MIEIVEKVESLELATPRRSSRKRRFVTNPVIEELPIGFKDSMAPPPAKKKLLDTKIAITKLYKNKSIGRIPKNGLETIYEDTNSKGVVSDEFIGKKKVKRYINLDREFKIVTKQKKEMRQKKIKRLGTGYQKRKKLSAEEFKKKLESIHAFVS